MKHFDPFNPQNRDKRKRRSKAQIAADKAAWNAMLERALRLGLIELGCPTYTQSDLLLEKAARHASSYYALRRNLRCALGKIGYTLLSNPNSKDGRWRAAGKNVFVYHVAGSPVLSAGELKVELEW